MKRTLVFCANLVLAIAAVPAAGQPAGNYGPPDTIWIQCVDGTVPVHIYSNQPKPDTDEASRRSHRRSYQGSGRTEQKLARIRAKRAELDKVKAETTTLLKKAVEHLDAVIAEATKARAELNRAIIESNNTKTRSSSHSNGMGYTR